MDNVKYIGMDVHKAAISIAVLNSSGKLVMESTIETKAITILDFLKGLRGSLHVTLEEGTWAAWLYDRIKPQVTELVVCNPRRNALLKEGSKSDRMDARKLAELLRSNMVRAVYHGEHGVRTLQELSRSYLTISTDLIRVMTRVKAIYRSWGIPCRGKQVYAERYRAQWLGQIQQAGVRRRGGFYYPPCAAQPCGVLLPAVRCAAVAVSAGAARVARRSAAARRLEIVTRDSIHRPDPGGSADCFDANTASFPHQAAALDLQRIWHRDAQQRRAEVRAGRAAARQETTLDSRAESQSQSRTEERIQRCCHRGRCQGWPVQRVLRCAGGQGNQAGDGASDFGAQDGRHHVNRLEERSALRRPTSETTNSLNVSGASVPSWNFFRRWSVGFRRHSGSRASLS